MCGIINMYSLHLCNFRIWHAEDYKKKGQMDKKPHLFQFLWSLKCLGIFVVISHQSTGNLDTSTYTLNKELQRGFQGQILGFGTTWMSLATSVYWRVGSVVIRHCSSSHESCSDIPFFINTRSVFFKLDMKSM